jgi:iron complex outermembrane receptor protein
VQVVANAEDTRGLSTKGLSGEFSIQEALARLLEGSGLQYKLDSAGTIIVTHAPVAQMHQSAAQDAPGTASLQRAAPEPATLEEVVVTSQKRVERLQDVPLAVTAISGESLSEAGINDTSRLSSLTPSLTFTEGAQPNNRNFRIRGIGTAVFGQGFEPSVSVVVDGVVLARASQGFTDLADIERVEVLRGPQGTSSARTPPAASSML